LIERVLSTSLRAALGDTPAVFVAGARQTGKSTLVEAYARRLDVDAVNRRLGYLLDLLGLEPPSRLRLGRDFRGFRWLDPSGRKERLGYSSEWGLILNVEPSDLLDGRQT